MGENDGEISTSSFFLSLGSKSRVFMSNSLSLFFSHFSLIFQKEVFSLLLVVFLFVCLLVYKCLCRKTSS